MRSMRANPIGGRPAPTNWIMRFDEFVQLAPRRDAINLSEKTVAPCKLLFGSVFEVGEALLHGRCRAVNVPILSQVGASVGTGTAE